MSADWREVLDESRVLERLAAFDPHVAGTFPLGLNVVGSDIDVLCHAHDVAAFAEAVWSAYAYLEHFALMQWCCAPHALIARFTLGGVAFELFGGADPVVQQAAWQHFEVERHLLDMGGEPFYRAVMSERARGLKTEPAFAKVLGLSGDAFNQMLMLALLDECDLRAWLGRAGFASTRPEGRAV